MLLLVQMQNLWDEGQQNRRLHWGLGHAAADIGLIEIRASSSRWWTYRGWRLAAVEGNFNEDWG
jgi:hypothetical protein